MKIAKKRVEEILTILLEYTVMNFSREIRFTEERDEMDAIAVGINSLGEELSHRMDELERKNKELEEKQKQMERKNKELEQIAFIAAHDLREPLVLIKSFSEKLKFDYKGKLDGTADLYIDYIHNSSMRMDLLMEGLLQYTHIRNVPFTKMVSLNDILQRVLEREKENIEKLKANIQADELPVVKADPEEMALLYAHLFSNALKFCHPQRTPEIKLEVKDTAENWQFCIRDNGIGIDKQYHEKIFQIFRQLNPRDKYTGIGLGLPYCRKVIEKHGGSIWLESSLDEGSMFYFTLPKNDYEKGEKVE